MRKRSKSRVPSQVFQSLPHGKQREGLIADKAAYRLEDRIELP